MRLLIILLIAANAGTYFWFQQLHAKNSSAQSEITYSDADYPQIVLLHEHLAKEEQAVSIPSEETGIVVIADEGEQKESPLPAEVVSSATQEEPVQQVAIVSEVDSLSSPIDVKPFDMSDEKALCWFVDLEEGEAQEESDNRKALLASIGDYFGSLGVSSEIVSVKVPRVQKQVIYLPARESSQQALADLKKLLQDGYDAFVFRQGEFRNAISLGFYSNKTFAKEMLEKFRSEGLDAQLAPWETFDIDPMLRVPDQNPAELSEHWRGVEDQWQGIRREKKYCNSVVAQG